MRKHSHPWEDYCEHWNIYYANVVFWDCHGRINLTIHISYIVFEGLQLNWNQPCTFAELKTKYQEADVQTRRRRPVSQQFTTPIFCTAFHCTAVSPEALGIWLYMLLCEMFSGGANQGLRSSDFGWCLAGLHGAAQITETAEVRHSFSERNSNQIGIYQWESMLETAWDPWFKALLTLHGNTPRRGCSLEEVLWWVEAREPLRI